MKTAKEFESFRKTAKEFESFRKKYDSLKNDKANIHLLYIFFNIVMRKQLTKPSC